MKDMLLAVSGWIVAAVFSVLAAVRAPAGGGSPSPAPAAPARPAARAPAARAAAPVAEPPSCGEPVAEAEERDCVQPGDDWEPPGAIDSPEGIYAFLSDASPADRDIGERIVAARKSGDIAALLSAAEDALRSSNPKVRAMAVNALKDMRKGEEPRCIYPIAIGYYSGEDLRILQREAYFTPEVEKTRAALLLEFCKDDNAYVRHYAKEAFFGAFEQMHDFDSTYEVAAKACDIDYGVFNLRQEMFMSRALGSDRVELDPERFEKGMRAMFELSGKNESVKECADKCFKKISRRVYAGGDLDEQEVSPEFLDQLIEGRKAQLDDLATRFPDDNVGRLAFDEMSEQLRRFSAERFPGEDPASAKVQTWIAEQQFLLQKRLSERDKSAQIDMIRLIP